MFERLTWLLDEKWELICKKRILLIGVGGVGSYALETLVRSGIGEITIVDGDVIDKSNLNRQLMTSIDNIGLSKVDVFLERIKRINPDCQVTAMNCFITEENLELLFEQSYDYVIDACDTVQTKVALIQYCLEHHIKFISSLGMACRLDSSKVTVTTLDKTCNDPLAKKMRMLIKQAGIKGKIPVVYSNELPIKNGKLGSIAHVPATAGLLVTNYIINDILGDV